MSSNTGRARCYECGYPLHQAWEPDGLLATCKQCVDCIGPNYRCPLCGGDLDMQVGGGDISILCRACMIETESEVWPAETLEAARFRTEMRQYEDRHPGDDLRSVSILLCEEIDRWRNGGVPSDPWLLVRHLAEQAEATTSPLGCGWRLKRIQRALTFTFDCRVDFVSAHPEGGWKLHEYQASLEEPDIVDRMVDWLRDG